MTKEEIEEHKRKDREYRIMVREQEKASHIPRLKEESSGINERESEWWKQTYNLCSIVQRACNSFFERRGIPYKQNFNKNYD